MTDILQKIKELEEKGDFHSHLRPVNHAESKPFGTEFPYIPKGLIKIKYALINFFIVRPFRRYQAKIVYKIKVEGAENLKGIKSAVVASNHIAIFDCLVLSFALKRRKVKFVAAEFNNKKGWFGTAMRAHGMLPLSSKYPVLKKFNQALEHYLSNGNLVVVYPEEAMWDMYEKPRPFKKGAFYYAAKFNVPIVPVFITMREDGKKNKDGSCRKYFTVNFAAPVYPKSDLSADENTNALKDAAHAACVRIYEKTYNKTLI